MENRHDKASRIAEQLVYGIREALKGESDEMPAMDLSEAIGPDGDVTAFFEGMLMATGVFYKHFHDKDSDILDLVAVLNRLAVGRILADKK